MGTLFVKKIFLNTPIHSTSEEQKQPSVAIIKRTSDADGEAQGGAGYLTQMPRQSFLAMVGSPDLQPPTTNYETNVHFALLIKQMFALGRYASRACRAPRNRAKLWGAADKGYYTGLLQVRVGS